MSMNLFFMAYTQKNLDEMDQNHESIDESINSKNIYLQLTLKLHGMF